MKEETPSPIIIPGTGYRVRWYDHGWLLEVEKTVTDRETKKTRREYGEPEYPMNVVQLTEMLIHRVGKGAPDLEDLLRRIRAERKAIEDAYRLFKDAVDTRRDREA